jgi:hypothetical protein
MQGQVPKDAFDGEAALNLSEAGTMVVRDGDATELNITSERA